MDWFLLTVKKAFLQITTEPILQTNSTLSNTSYHRFPCAKHAISLASIIQPETRHRSCMMAARSKHLHDIPEKIWCLCIRQQGNYPSLKEGGIQHSFQEHLNWAKIKTVKRDWSIKSSLAITLANTPKCPTEMQWLKTFWPHLCLMKRPIFL